MSMILGVGKRLVSKTDWREGSDLDQTRLVVKEVVDGLANFGRETDSPYHGILCAMK